MTPTPSPRTAAGRALLQSLAEMAELQSIGKAYIKPPARFVASGRDAILAIEAEAAAPGGGLWTYLYDDYEKGTVFVTDDPTGEQEPLIEDITESEAQRLVLAHNAALAAPAEDHSEEHWHRGPSQSCSICKFAASDGTASVRPSVPAGSGAGAE